MWCQSGQYSPKHWFFLLLTFLLAYIFQFGVADCTVTMMIAVYKWSCASSVIYDIIYLHVIWSWVPNSWLHTHIVYFWLMVNLFYKMSTQIIIIIAFFAAGRMYLTPVSAGKWRTSISFLFFIGNPSSSYIDQILVLHQRVVYNVVYTDPVIVNERSFLNLTRCCFIWRNWLRCEPLFPIIFVIVNKVVSLHLPNWLKTRLT